MARTRRGMLWPWRPREAAASGGSITEAIYGLILATSVIAVSREYESTDALLIAVSVLVTGVVFWLAHVYARVLARHIETQSTLTRAELRAVFRHDWPLVGVTIPLVMILLLGAVGALPDRTAVLLAIVAALFELSATGVYAARAAGARGAWVVLSGLIALGLGGAVVLLKVLVH